jgi:CxxC motif-containing protein (DUF1111 family)
VTFVAPATVALILLTSQGISQAPSPNFGGAQPRDPGVRQGKPGAGGSISGLSTTEMAMFKEVQLTFQEVDNPADGLGPRFNLDQCSGCHKQPDVGGSSPQVNPQIALATALGARNIVPQFLREGPIREVRFKSDGGVHALFTIAGRSDAPGCSLAQPDFSNASNLSFRIPTPLFGDGLIEAIPDSTIRANLAANGFLKSQFGISGKVNTSGNDGTVTRFGWKAQNKSLGIFSGEAYNVEQGVTNELFPTERDETAGCQFAATPNDTTDMASGHIGDVEQFAIFAKFLAPPTPAPSTDSTNRGQALFNVVGCALCHTPTLTTGRSSTAALSNKQANLYSDLALHDMGSGLADGIAQGNAQSGEFRTAPLWGLGQRIFFLHDGRTSDLMKAIDAHSSAGSEANRSISVFDNLNNTQQQDILNFLRSL